MTSLVTHRFIMASSILGHVSAGVIPQGTHFRNKPNYPHGYEVILPANTYYIEYDTGIVALDMLLSYIDAQQEHTEYFCSDRHKLIGSVAKHVIASHGWSPSTNDAITVTWMAVIGLAKFVEKYGQLPHNRMTFYNKAIEEGFYYDCETWKEFL